jgi:hypothetical protein
VNADVCVSNTALDPYLRARRWGKRNLRVSSVYLRRCDADECERNPVLSGIAAFHMSCSVIRMRRLGVVLVKGKRVNVLRMIVVIIGVGVEQRPHAGSRNQRRDEQRCQGAVHNDESMRRRRAGQNDRPPTRSRHT